MIHLTRPLTFFDLESTGADRNNDRIIQFCFITHHPNGGVETFTHLVNPEMPISIKATEVTGITDEQVKDAPAFRNYAHDIFEHIKQSDLVGFGCLLFDVPLLFNELQRCGFTWDYTATHIIDACNIYKRNAPRDLSSAFKFYKGDDMVNAHDAQADVEATRDVFFAQLDKHDIPGNIEQLALYSNYDKRLVDLSGKFVYNDKGDVVLNFTGKKGELAKDHIDLLHWVLSKDFPEDVKMVCRNIIEEDNCRLNKMFESSNPNELPF